MAKSPPTLGELERNDVAGAVSLYFATLDRLGDVPEEVGEPLIMLQDDPSAYFAAIARETKARDARR